MKDAPQAVAILQAAVRRLDLADTPLGDEVNKLAEGVPADSRKRFGEPHASGRAR